ncbi:hypothetical protein BBJ28_00018372 [Nothophytophthora sp. Chile5]|nr:hypothetical protein BBJ28_00018372 [Nothophytophthora sp. Chile5]
MSDEAGLVSAVPRILAATPAAHQSLADFPVLTSVRVICRECLSARGVDPLPHVLLLIDSFLDTISGPGAVERGCSTGVSVRKLTYLAARDTESFWKRAQYAAANGHLHVLQWLTEFHSDRCEWTTYAMDSAAQWGHLSVIQWLHENRDEGCSVGAMNFTAITAHLDVLQWLHVNRSEGCSEVAFVFAAVAGRLEVLQWLHERYADVTRGSAIRVAARNGKLAVVQWLYTATGEAGERYRDYSELALIDATRNGHVDVVDWLNMQRKTRRDLQ